MRHDNGVLNMILRLLCAAVLVAAVAGAVGRPAGAGDEKLHAQVPDALLAAAAADPRGSFDVIVQGESGSSSSEVGADVGATAAENPGRARGIGRQFRSIAGVSAELTGKQLLKLAERKSIFAITLDTTLVGSEFASRQQWPYAADAHPGWSTAAQAVGTPPTIAVVDSGIDATRPDFGGRVLTQVDVYSGTGANAVGDGRGHGTFVASVAAGEALKYAGVAPTAPLVSLDVIDDAGSGSASDLIAACDWILANKDRYGIRVANMSVLSGSVASIRTDPVDRAVERLWFSGVVVVTASGNFGTGATASGVPYAPANDPFVITVGATDISGSVSSINDATAPWSAWGYTSDGFLKPDLSAPGRYMVAAVPPSSTFALEHPERIVEPGYMQISGTSFAAPVVAGTAAGVLAAHPSWTPDMVKGALMLRAKPLPSALPRSAGVGAVDSAAAAAVTNPPNPNLALDRYVVLNLDGSLRFDAEAWAAAAALNPSWDAATGTLGTWAPASWAPATWLPATWIPATWDTATWTTGTWAPATWAPATWAPATWDTATWTTGTWAPATWVTGDPAIGDAGGGYWLTDAEIAQLLTTAG